MKLERMIELTQELVNARGPSGQEAEVRDIVLRELKELCDKVWVDEAGNAIGLIRGASKRGRAKAPIIKVMAHMDELCLMVKRIEDNGTLRVRPVGGLFPWATGLGPVEVMGDERVLPGVLSLGALHTTAESAAVWKSKPDGGKHAPEWSDTYVFTRLTPEELEAAGVHAGTLVVLAQSRRQLLHLGDCIGGYFFDDRVCLTIMLAAAALLRAEKKRPASDVYLIGTCIEEVSGGAASFAADQLPGTVTLAVDVGPVAAEYRSRLTAEPIIVYRDGRAFYTKSICDHLVALGHELGLAPQTAVWEGYGSDASAASQGGHAPMSALLCIATENTHSFEIVAKEGIANCARLLAAYLQQPV